MEEDNRGRMNKIIRIVVFAEGVCSLATAVFGLFYLRSVGSVLFIPVLVIVLFILGFEGLRFPGLRFPK